MKIMKKITAASLATLSVICMTVTVFAATSTSFKVNNVTIKGTISCKDTNDYNFFIADSVTAETTATSVMDSLTTTAIIYYTEGSTNKTAKDSNTEINATSCSVTVAESLTGVGYRGEGTHSASHAGKNGSGETFVTW